MQNRNIQTMRNVGRLDSVSFLYYGGGCHGCNHEPTNSACVVEVALLFTIVAVVEVIVVIALVAVVTSRW